MRSTVQVLKLLHEHGPFTVRDMEACSDMTISAIRGAVYRLALAGKVEPVGKEIHGRGRPHVRYGITDIGRSYLVEEAA